MSFYDGYDGMYDQPYGCMPLPMNKRQQVPMIGGMPVTGGQMPMFPPSQQIGTTLPTGMPAGTAMAPMPTTAMVPMPTPTGELSSQTTGSPLYTPGFLATQIGKNVKVEFLIGTNMLVDREGTLLAVGASYIIIRETDTDDMLLCDLYSIKFVKFFY